MWTATFWKDATERLVKSAFQAAGLYLGGDVFNVWQADWRMLGGIAASAAFLSLVTSFGSSLRGDPTSASLVR